MNSERPPLDHEHERVGYIRLQDYSSCAANNLCEAWQRPIRHNRRIEQRALSDLAGVVRICRTLSEGDRKRAFVTPRLPSADSRYDIEAAIRSIPDIVPFTPSECELIEDSRDPRADVSGDLELRSLQLSHPTLVERWHEWLWDYSAPPGQRGVSPNPDAEALAAGCARLSQVLYDALETWPLE
jgi:hypothetical protein